MSSASKSTLGALAALALLPLLAACQDQAASAIAKPERPVQVQQVEFQSDSASGEFVGVVRARYETDLGFRVAGKITERIVDAGDTVHAGDLIARLDPKDLQLQVASAEAEISAATSNFAQTSSDEERYTALKARGFAAVADYERKKAAKDEAEGRLERARRALDLARNQLAYAELKADADGVITAALAEPGQVVAIGQAVARLAQHGEMEAVVALPETWLGETRAVAGDDAAVVGAGAELLRPAARAVAPGGPVDPHLCGALHHRAARRHRRARHDRDGDAVAHVRPPSRSCRSPRCSTAVPARRSTSSTRPACSSCAR